MSPRLSEPGFPKTVVGIDLGSRTTKLVQMVDREICHFELFNTGHNPLQKVGCALDRLDYSKIVATGYGRHLLAEHFDAECVTEIKACAKGVYEQFPSCTTILDVGGQDCKVVLLGNRGQVAHFEMNDRCAAGTGKFLEVMAQTFELSIERFVESAQRATEAVAINSMCTVFAESEVVSLITSGTSKERIALGLHRSIANRLYAMLHSRPATGEFVFIGGGAKNDCLHALLEAQAKCTVKRPENPQIVSAIGAALLAGER